MRKGELQSLKWHDIDFNQGHIGIFEQKNGKIDYIPMNDITRQTLMRVPKIKDSAYVFNYDYKHSFNKAMKRAKIKNFSFLQHRRKKRY